MSSRDRVDPELLPGLEMLDFGAVSAESLPALRGGMSGMADAIPLPDVPVDVERTETPGLNGAPAVPLTIYTPRERRLSGVLLHIHGGGYVLGSVATNHAMNLKLADALGAVVVAVSYRLAPETPHPGPLDDCTAALGWVAANAERLGVDGGRLAVMGESAGGGLAAALIQRARDEGGPKVCHQHLIYPMIDDRTCTRPVAGGVGEFVWTNESNAFGWASLMGVAPGSPSVPSYAAAARMEDLSGLPPTYIAVGDLDLFIEEDIDYARRLIAAGVPTELHVYRGAYHGFNVVEGAAVTQAFWRDSLAALGRALV